MAEWFMQVGPWSRRLQYLVTHTRQPACMHIEMSGWAHGHETGLMRMSHLLQGFLDKLLDRHDGLSKEVLRKAVFYVVPCANPDGEQVLPPGDGPVPDSWLPKTPCLGFTYEPGHCVI